MPSGTIDTLLIDIKGTASNVSESIDKLTASLEKLTKNLNTSGLDKLNTSLVNIGNSASYAAMATKDINGLGKATSKLSSVLKGGAIAVGIKLIGDKIWHAVDAASTYIEDINLFNVSMRQYAEEAFEYGQKVSSIMGIDIGEWARNQGVIMTLAKGFGVASDRANIMSKNLTQLAYDISSFYNLDIEKAMQKVQSGLAGELEPLRRIGYDLSKARLEEYATDLGITKQYDAMNQAEKSQLRYYAMMKQVVEVQGDMSRTLNQPANQLRVLKAQFQQATRAIGSMFIPALQAILPYAIAVVRVITNIANALARLFGYEPPEVGGLEDLSVGAEDLSDNLDKATGRAKKLKHQLAGFDEINNLTTNQGGSGSGVAGGSFINFPLPQYDFLGNAASYIDQFIAKVTPLISIIAAVVAAFATWKLGTLFLEKLPVLLAGIKLNLLNIIAAIAAHPILAAIAAVIALLVVLYMNSEDFRNYVDESIVKIKEWINTIPETINNLVAHIQEKGGIINAIAEWVGQGVVGIARWVATHIKEIVSGIVTAAVKIFTGLVATVSRMAAGMFTGFMKSVTDFVGGITKTLGGIITFITGVFSGDWDKAWQGLSDIISGIFQTIGSVIATPINVAIGAINGVVDSINKVQLKIPNWVPIIGGNTYSVNIKKLPFLAQGGVIDQPTTALLGEEGPEAVVPLKNNTEWINKVAASINGKNDNSQIETLLEQLIDVVQSKDLTIDGNSITNTIVKNINKKSRLLGEGLV